MVRVSGSTQRANALADMLVKEPGAVLSPELRAELVATLHGLVAAVEINELLLEARLEELAAVREVLATISYPVIEVRPDVLCLPIVGPIDAHMMDRVIDAALREVASRSARWMIVDLTGAQLADISAADSLLRLFVALRLLGARAMLSGVSPTLAMTLVERGQTLTIPTHASLAAALRATERETGARA
jgi:rsbT co-antagonist protein RsbR